MQGAVESGVRRVKVERGNQGGYYQGREHVDVVEEEIGLPDCRT
jgi:hypothetical protein